jgi:hypothetical protein
MKSVSLAATEAKVVQQALDAAIRQGGANAAVVILPIMQSIERQLLEQVSAEAVGDLASPNPET